MKAVLFFLQLLLKGVSVHSQKVAFMVNSQINICYFSFAYEGGEKKVS